MYLRDINLSADDAIVERFKGGFVAQFFREASCISILYMELISRQIVTEKTPSVVAFKFTDELLEPPEKWAIGGCSWPFDFAKYVQSTPSVKKRMIVDALQAALLWMASKMDWPLKPFETAYEEAIRRDLVLERMAKKSWVSPNKQYRVRVFFRYDLEGVELAAVLSKNRSSNELARLPLGVALPYHGCLADYLSDGRWTSNTEFILQSGSFIRERWVADFSAFMT
ncbi:MAG: hypothetical protein JW888_18680 [Pirellulales bacterium]|nr:hypothetical protein [Pirellulales bacterium]